MITLNQINKAITKVHPGVELVRGEGYFYIVGTTDEMSDKINMLYNTSICIHHLNQQPSIETWVNDVTRLLKQGL